MNSNVKKVAAIDIGTNSVRLLKAELANNKIVNKEKVLAMTRIGKDVDASRMLAPQRMQDTIEALVGFKKQLTAFGLDDCPVFATSAVRDAANRQDFISAVHKATGFKVEVISGEQEAALGFAGVVKGAGSLIDVAINPRALVLVIDIGGGSTELIIGNVKGDILVSHSLDIGAVRMTDRHNLTHGHKNEDFHGIKKDVDQALVTFLEKAKRVNIQLDHDLAFAIGIGGTATTIGAIDLEMAVYDSTAVHLHEVSANSVAVLANRLACASLDEKLNIPGLMPKRADIIAAGVVIMSHLLSRFSLKGYFVSDDDNLEGAIYSNL